MFVKPQLQRAQCTSNLNSFRLFICPCFCLRPCCSCCPNVLACYTSVDLLLRISCCSSLCRVPSLLASLLLLPSTFLSLPSSCSWRGVPAVAVPGVTSLLLLLLTWRSCCLGCCRRLSCCCFWRGVPSVAGVPAIAGVPAVAGVPVLPASLV